VPVIDGRRDKAGEDQAEHRRPSFRHGFAYGALGFAVSVVIALVTSVVTARLYGVTVVGEFALTSAPTGVVWSLSSVCESPALMKRLAPLGPREPLVTGLFAAVFGFSTLLTTAVTALAAIGAWLLLSGPVGRPDLVTPALVSLVCYLVIVNPAWNMDTVFAAFRAGGELFWIRLHQAVASLALTIALRPVTGSVWALVVAFYGSWLTSSVHRLILIRRWMRILVPLAVLRQGYAELGAIVRFGLKLAPGTIAIGLSNDIGVWVLGIRTTSAAVGAYSRAWALAGRL
jgi:O-antigen/teichoic acid export membrane protein